MSFNPRSLLPPLLAVGILTLVIAETARALRRSGAWQAQAQMATVPPDDPYLRLDRVLARKDAAVPADPLRNPFGFGGQTAAPPAHRPPPPRKPQPPPRPVLTAIIWDNDPRALIRWDGRDYTVRAGSLFENFRVTSIKRDQVILIRGSETFVLKRPTKGEGE